MIIDIRDYTERWLNDYIVYHSGHFADEYGDLDRAGLYFDLKYKQAIDNMVEDSTVGQMQALQATMKSQGKRAAVGLDVLDKLQNGGLLEQTMDEIADALNDAIERYYSSGAVNTENYEDIIKQAKKFNSALSKGYMSQQKMNEFFDLLLKGIEQAGKIDLELLDGLTDIGKTLTGNSSFQIDQSWRKRGVKTLTKQDADMCQKVLEYLTHAADRFTEAQYTTTTGKNVSKNANTLDAQSFSSTINNIFSTVIGEQLSRTILAKGLQIAINDADSKIVELMQRQGNGRVTLGRGKWTQGGSRHDENNRVSKVDIFNQRAFELTVEENGRQYNIEIGANTSVKWYKGLSHDSSIHLVAGSPLGSYFKSGTPERYLAYNVIAHRWSPGEFHDVYRSLRASTAATFFNEWMTGTGGNIVGSRMYVNKVQFLMINGKIYSVMRIVRNICDDLAKRESWTESANMPFNMSVPRKDVNKWQGDSGPNVPDAMIRSKLVNEVMNKIGVTASLNANTLLQYAY